jgi:hypothetical protein
MGQVRCGDAPSPCIPYRLLDEMTVIRHAGDMREDALQIQVIIVQSLRMDLG